MIGNDIMGSALKDYTPLADDGRITSPKTYMVYEMNINPSGVEDTLIFFHRYTTKRVENA